MANLNKLKISGTSYDLQDLNATKSVTLTQAEYDNLQVKDPNTFYVISDGQGGGGGGIDSGTVQSMIDESISGKTDESAFTAHASDTTVHTNATEKAGWDGKATVVSLTQDDYDLLPSSAKTLTNVLYNITDATAADLSQYWTSAQTNSAINAAVSGKQDTLSAGTGIDITDNVISATGGGGGGKAISAGTNISVTTGETADTINCTLPITVNSNHVYSFGSNTLTDIYSAFVYGVNNNISKLSNSDYSFYNIIGRNNNAKGSELNIIGYGNSVSHSNVSRGAIRSVFVGNNNGSSGTGQYNFSNRIIIGFNNTISGGSYNAAIGNNLICGSYSETALGRYNNSVTEDSSQTNYSGNTIFSIGNGTSNSARHNAFEIRQNGDIYYFDGSNDVKLQDKISTIETTIGNINTVLESI